MGNKVVVIGGNYGAETGVSLGREGKDVTMVEETDTVIRPIYVQDLYSRTFMLERLVQEANVKIMKETKVIEINDAGVVVENGEGKQTLECDKVLLAYDRKSKTDLYEKLKGKAPEVYPSGDCVEPFNIYRAIDDGAYYGRKI